jgi:hypothetical protein
MTRPGAVRAGIWLSIYAAGGSLVGCLGFGMLWRGLSGRAWSEALLGLGLLVLGLDRAAVAFSMSMRARRSARPAPPQPPTGGDHRRPPDPGRRRTGD